MKSQIKRFSKSTLSVILSLCMLVSCMTVGIIATDAAVNWYDYSGNSHHYIYYDDSTANISAGGTKNVYAMMGYTGGSNVFQMERVSTSTLLYRLDYNNKWEGCVGFGVKGASSTPSGAVTTADRYTTSGNFNGNATVFAYGSKTGTTLTTNAWNANNGDEKTFIKNNVSLKTKVADAGSSNYSETSTTIATLTLSSHYWNGSNVSSAGDASGFADGSVTYNNAVGAAAIGFSYSDLNSNYNFIGWYDSSGNQLGTGSTYSGYQQGHVSAISYYAYFQKKEAVYGVVGTENLTGNNWDQTSSDNDMTKSGTTYTKVFSNKSAGNYEFKIAQNRSWDTSWGYDSSKVSFSGLASNNGSTSGNNIKFTTSGSSNITITFDSSTENITVNAVSNLTPLDAPTNIKLNNASSDLTVDTTVVGAKIRLSWNTVANAGTYKVYKGETLVDTVSTLFYDIERAYSSTGTYTVVAVPSDANTYTESPKSTGLTLTVNKSKLNKPTISVQPTDIANGSSVELTLTDTNTSFTATQFNYYYYTGNTVTISDTYKITPGTPKSLEPTSDTTYKACAYPVNGENNDYYLQSDTKEADVVYVSTPAWHLTGDLVTGQGGETGWPTKITTYPVNTFVSHNVFYRSVTVSGGAATAKHYFRLTNQTNQYGNGSDTDMAAYDGSTTAKKLTCSTTGTSGAMYVTGNGTFKIYVDQSSSSAPKVWVVNNEWSITSTAYYQTYNLTNDAYNAAQKGTTGGTVSGDVEVVKGTSTTLTATPATGYAFDGWYSNTDFAAAHKVYSNASYTFTPSANGDYYALFKKIVNRYNVELSFTSTQANVSATYHGKTISTNGATMSVPEGATVTYSISAKTGAQLGTITPSGITSGTNKSYTMPSSNVTITVNSSWINYTLAGATSPTGKGSVKFYSNSACTTQVQTANYGNTVYAKYDPGSSGYVLKSFSVSGTGASLGTRSGNIIPVTVGSSNVVVTATVVLQYSVTYYVDMHSNEINSLSFAVVAKTGTNTYSVIKDNDNVDCKATLGDTQGKYQLTKQGSSKVYAATITTPVTLSGSTYSDLYFRITFNGTDYIKKISGGNTSATNCIVDDLINSGEIWLEAKNDPSTPLTVNYATRSTPAVADGYRRIYVAKPYSWETSETNWATLGIYHWGEYTDIGWSNGIRMNYLGNSGSDGYHYYYADIPKALASNGTTVVTDGTGNKVSNIIFQGWSSTNPAAGTSPNAQTGNIENIPDSANFYILSKEDGAFVGTKSEEDAVIANYTRYVSSVTMNKTEQTEVNIKPTYTGTDVTYTSGDERVVTVDDSGIITPVGRGTTTITAKIYGTIGTLVTNEDTILKDYVECTTTVTVNDPSHLSTDGFEIMSLQSETYTVSIPSIDNDQPGYFDFSNDDIMVFTVTGLKGVNKSTNSAIIFDVSTGAQPNSFKIKYAKANTVFSGYSGIRVVGDIVTKSILNTSSGKRYGLDFWKKYTGSTAANPNPNYTTSKIIENGVETVVTKGIIFGKDDSDNNVYNRFEAIFAKYDYVDVTFTFSYYEYNPELSEDGMINYPYESTWAGTETIGNTFNKKVFTVTELVDGTVKGSWAANGSAGASTPCVTLDVSAVSSSGGNWYAWTWGESDGRWITGNRNGNIITFADNDVDNNIIFVRMNAGDAMNWNNAQNKTADLSSRSHNLKTVTVSNYEVRNKTADTVEASDLVTPALSAIGVKPDNNYYSYSIAAANITISNRSSENYTASAAVNIAHSVKHYSVYLNGNLVGNNYTYQQYAEPSVQNPADWYAVDERYASNTINAPLLATNVNSYKFRVKGDTYLRTATATNPHGDDFLRSEVDFSHYEVIHRDNPTTTQVELVEYLLQNFYIADFFSPANVLDPNTDDGNGGHLQYDDAQFVGGGVVYYSMNGVTENNPGTPFANAVSSGYVNGTTGTIDADAIKEMLKTNIEAQYAKDSIAGTAGEETAMKVAYGTEIAAKKNVEGGFNTGIIYRYLPLNQYKRDAQGKLLNPDEDGNYAYDVNTNTFRYSNTLQSYQYVYASGNENKTTNAGKNMRLYSYYVYSYVAYNQETNVPETKYEIVISDNYSDASTYWNGNTGN